MTQKRVDRGTSRYPANHRPSEIADESLRQTIEILLNLVEQLNSEVKNLTQETNGCGMKTTKGTREAGHQSQATQRRKVISLPRERKQKP